MTWDEFYDKITRRFSYAQTWGGKNETRWHGDANNYEVEWRTGGMSGGNCWGDEPSYSLDADDVPEMTGIDELFAEICPNITFLEYKRVMKDLVESDSRTEYEYYGNHTNYGIRRVNYRQLYDRLVEVGVLS